MQSKRKVIFLVDDDMVNLTYGNDIIAGFYDVFTFNSGSRLLKMLEKRTPDLILLDVEMPEMSGYEVIKLIKGKEETKDIPIIFLTAKSDADSELMGLTLGAIDYIHKPFSTYLLLKRLEIHLLIESQRHELVKFNNNLQDMVEEKTKAVVQLQEAILMTVAELVDSRDDITGNHIEHTTQYLKILIEAAQKRAKYKKIIAKWNIALVLQSAQLHDVGKIAIKDGILNKPGKLTDEEFDYMKRHVIIGEKVIDKIKNKTSDHDYLEQAKILVSTHHERWDGSGYPRGLRGNEIPLQGRLMAVVDVYDALISERPYKKAFSHEKAVSIILEGKGTQFDPDIVDIFMEVNHKFKSIAENGKNEQPHSELQGKVVNSIL